jgi:hypothetical protein
MRVAKPDNIQRLDGGIRCYPLPMNSNEFVEQAGVAVTEARKYSAL